MKGWSENYEEILMLGKFCPAMRSLLPNLLGKKLMNIHSLIRGPCKKDTFSFYIFHIIICLCANSNSNCKFYWELIK